MDSQTKKLCRQILLCQQIAAGLIFFLSTGTKARSADNFSILVEVDKELLPTNAEDTSPTKAFELADFPEIANPDIEGCTSACTSESTESMEPGNKKQKKSSEQVDLKAELFRYLKAKDGELDRITSEMKHDRFDDFGSFVASELRSKPAGDVSIHMQQICQVLYAHVEHGAE